MNIQLVNDGGAVKPSMRKLISLWQTIFPAAFPTPPKPLKIGIHLDLEVQFPNVPARLIAAALGLYTRRLAYLNRLKKAGAARVDLTGSQVGTVSDGDAHSAACLVRNFNEKKWGKAACSAQRAQPPPTSTPSAFLT